MKTYIGSGARFSPDRKYRYKLLRIWDTDKKLVCIIGLNPSTADEVRDDATVRRCVAFTQSWGYGGLWLGNIFAYRATDPRGLFNREDAIGPENDTALLEMAKRCEMVVGAWGDWGELLARGNDVARMFPNLMCLGVTSHGQPKHPLYLRKTTIPVPFREKVK